MCFFKAKLKDICKITEFFVFIEDLDLVKINFFSFFRFKCFL